MDIGPQDDDKLARLRTFLKGTSGEKVLIFSEAETTVDYLYEQLNPSQRNHTIAKLSGSNRDQRAAIVSRFAPQANLQDRNQMQGEEIRVLIATDVVSEGQNMQDCARVLNYDLHWNPARLIQRFGRVDRIGSLYEEIHLHNMIPDAKLDVELGLTATLRGRIQAFHDLIGLDNKVLSEEEQLNAQGVGVIYDARELPELDDALDEVATNQRAIALLQNIRSNDPDLWRTIPELPDGIRSALTCSNSGTAEDAPRVGETMVMLAASGAVRCYAVGDALTPRPIRTAQFITAAECESDAPTQPLPENTNERVNAAAEVFRNDLSQRLGTVRRRTPGNARNRSFIRRQLKGVSAGIATSQRIHALQQAFSGDLPSVVETELSDLRRINLGGRKLVLRLELLQERYRLNSIEQNVPSTIFEPARILCSDGLL